MTKRLTGPFTQLLPLDGLPLRGPLNDDQLRIISNGGILYEDDKIIAVGDFETLRKTHPECKIDLIEGDAVGMPGLIDCHTHLLYAGTRARDFALRNAGSSYLEIAAAGGGIMDSVNSTRNCSSAKLIEMTLARLDQLARVGVTTCEIKTGYGLTVDQEIRMLEAINQVGNLSPLNVVPTCLAAHLKPKDLQSSNVDYLAAMSEELLPRIKHLTKRVDIFVETGAFTVDEGRTYLRKAKALGYGITVHADQFSAGGSHLAVEMGALSADHLEASGADEIALLGKSKTVAVALPGASVGLGVAFTPARKLLDAGACVAIASDYNPGSAPMGELLTQASILATYEKLANAEVLAGLTVRAAAALGLTTRGTLEAGKQADFIAYSTSDYREITYQQGRLRPHKTWINGSEYHY